MNKAGKTAQSVGEKFTEENSSAEKSIEEGDLRGAARILVDIVEKDPQNWRAFNNMGILSWMQHAWHDAISMFLKAASIKPDETDTLINLFDAALKLHRINDVVSYFEKALAVNPNLEEIKIILDGIKEQGEEIYNTERALKIGAYNPTIEEADKLVEEGKLYQAMEKYLQVNDTQGPNADAFCGMGIISFYQQRFEDAFSLFLESIKLNPVKLDGYLNLIDAAKSCGKTEFAKKIYAIYLKELPGLKVIAGEFEKT